MALTGGENVVQHLEDDLRRLLGIGSNPAPSGPAPSLPQPLSTGNQEQPQGANKLNPPPGLPKPSTIGLAELEQQLREPGGKNNKPVRNKKKPKEAAKPSTDQQQSQPEANQNRKKAPVRQEDQGQPNRSMDGKQGLTSSDEASSNKNWRQRPAKPPPGTNDSRQQPLGDKKQRPPPGMKAPKKLPEKEAPAKTTAPPADQAGGGDKGKFPPSEVPNGTQEDRYQQPSDIVTVGVGREDEEMVRIVVMPPPVQPARKKKKGGKREVDEDSDQSSGDSGENGSSSEGSASSGEDQEEEDRKPLQEQQQRQPLVLVLPKKEVALFRLRGVLPLRHINPKFTRAMFHCRLCSFHISSIPEVYRHIKDDRHVRLQTAELSKQTAHLMPLPQPEICDVIGQLIHDVYMCSRLGPQELELRRTATEALRTLIEATFPGFTIRPYGSCFTELGLKDSSVNVGLIRIIPEASAPSTPGLIIISVFTWLQQQPLLWTNVTEDFNCRVPVVRFQHAPSGVRFDMVIESENAYKTAVLLRQYRQLDSRLAILTVAFRTFARICCLDQPELGSLPPHAFTLMVLFFMQKKGVLPVLHQMSPSKETDPESYLTAEELLERQAKGEWTPQHQSLGQLWLGLLKFYAYSFAHNELAVCVRTTEPLLRSTKHWGNRRIALEDPFHPSVNVGSTLANQPAFEFFMECLRNMFFYFWVPQTDKGPLFTHLVAESDGSDPIRCTPEEAKARMAALKKDDVKWDFNPEKILRSRRLPVNCGICGRDGHSRAACPELDVPPVGYIPPPDFGYLALLDNVCWNIFRNFAQREVDQQNRQAIRKELESHIRNHADFAKATLTLFGSSCNGFGFADSDLDLCLTFEDNPDGQGLDFVAIVKKLAKILRKNRFFCDIVPISSAKVPIVKLRHRPTGLESDISLYNQLGRRNSQLLATYSAIDPRVRILGYMAKLLAKQCEIGDASRGSLSSYGYTLLVIHYLQQVKPPVIPVLQEIVVDGVDRSKFIVEGCDTWFFEDSQNLPRAWPHFGANREPPSTLWLGFLLYYAELFNYRQQVVCIRQLKPLYRLEKMWTDRPIAIEDPFDLTHNLGSGISLRMGAYIRRVFVAARRFFQTPVKRLPPNFSSLEEYLFNPKVLAASGPPPNDRGCLVCGKVGHKAKECEFRRGGGGAGNNHNRGGPRQALHNHKDHQDNKPGQQVAANDRVAGPANNTHQGPRGGGNRPNNQNQHPPRYNRPPPGQQHQQQQHQPRVYNNSRMMASSNDQAKPT